MEPDRSRHLLPFDQTCLKFVVESDAAELARVFLQIHFAWVSLTGSMCVGDVGD